MCHEFQGFPFTFPKGGDGFPPKMGDTRGVLGFLGEGGMARDAIATFNFHGY